MLNDRGRRTGAGRLISAADTALRPEQISDPKKEALSARRADQRVGRPARVEHLAGTLGAGDGEPLWVNQPELCEHRGLIPVDVLVGEFAVAEMHYDDERHLDPSPDCPCPAPRARDIVAPIDAFHDLARAMGVPIIHVRSVLRRGGVDDIKGISAAWRRTFPLYVGAIPNSDAHAIESRSQSRPRS